MTSSSPGKRVAVVVPAYNEETQIQGVLSKMPEFVDTIYVVDDASTDDTHKIVSVCGEKDERVTVLRHERNSGVGAAIATGYLRALNDGIDVACVMAGDGQMDPDDLETVARPVLEGKVDYCKGNRFFYDGGIKRIPRSRLIGNFVLSALTKLVSGYWHISDTQCGYTAIGKRALSRIDIDNIYRGYGCPNDILTKLNISGLRVAEVPVNPLYGVGETSKMNISRVVLPILLLMGKLFVQRMFQKYVIRTGHPLVLAYLFSALLFLVFVILSISMIINLIMAGFLPKVTLIVSGVTLILSVQLALSAFEMDFNYNKDLCVVLESEKLSSGEGE